MTLDELRNLDPKDAGNWPMGAQLGVFAFLLLIVLGIAYYQVWTPQLEEIEAARQQEETLKQEWRVKQAEAINLEEYKRQLDQIQQDFGKLLKQLPTKSDMPSLLRQINEAGVGRGLKFALFQPGTEAKNAEFAELPILIELNGSYHYLAVFVRDVARLNRIVTMGNLQLAATGNAVAPLNLKAEVKTYRVLDEAELQAARQAEADAARAARR